MARELSSVHKGEGEGKDDSFWGEQGQDKLEQLGFLIPNPACGAGAMCASIGIRRMFSSPIASPWLRPTNRPQTNRDHPAWGGAPANDGLLFKDANQGAAWLLASQTTIEYVCLPLRGMGSGLYPGRRAPPPQ